MSYPRPPGPGLLADLELEVMGLLSTGSSDAAIAERLGLDVRTVRVVERSAYAKMGVTSRVAAVTWCSRHGLAGAC